MTEAKVPEHEEQAEESPEETPSKTPAKSKGRKRAPAKKKNSKDTEVKVPWWQGLSHRRKSHLRSEQ